MTTLTLIFALPLLASIVLAFVPRNLAVIARAVACGVTFVTMVLLGILMFCQFNGATADTNGYQVRQHYSVAGRGIARHRLQVWRGRFECRLGADGRNRRICGGVLFIRDQITREGVYILLLTMTGGILGAFMSTDLFFFYFFHELALVPTFIMIGVWGRGERKNFATFQITIYLSIGALLALIGLIALYLQLPADVRTFDIPTLTKYFSEHTMAKSAQMFVFPLLL